ncbi:MAG: FHA domain-containing protein [Gammaproteobacteria bacterium]|nr:FHA domain-containing protein [Gammaproteobacteria bacterium]
MAKLIIKFNNEVVDHVELRQGDMKIGRKPGCEIFIDNLAISGEHANVFTVGDDSFIQDLGSTNGTFINNKKISKHHLKNGDAVVIGKHTLVFITETVRANKQPDDFAKTVIIPSARDANASITVETSLKDAPAPKTERLGAIFILSGVNSGKRIELTKKVTNLGKVGKRAGAINQIGDGYTLMPGEDETPKLNGKTVPREGMKLKNGDVIEVTSTRLQFYLK